MAATTHHRKALLPILMTCAGYACYNLSDAASKQLVNPQGGNLHFSQMMLTASALTAIVMVIYGWFTDGKKAFRTNKPGLVLVHALLAQTGSVVCYLSFPHITLTTFYTLVFTSPFMVALLSSWFLKDKIDRKCLAAILFGFCVVLYIYRPGGGLFSVWAMLILLNAVLFSCRMVLVRYIGSGESKAFLFMTSSLVGVLVGVFFLGDHYKPLVWTDWSLFSGLALASAGGLLCLGYAFQAAPSASVVAPYHYTQIIWGTLLGYFLFGDVPKLETLIGAALLISSGLYLINHERRKAALKPPEA